MNKRNYQKELDKLIEDFQAEGRRPRLLVHSCCAPCSSYVMEYLSRYFELTMFFYNPNMDSRAEYNKRAAELDRLIGELNQKADDSGVLPASAPIKLIVAEYDPESFDEIARGHESDPERGPRCHRCYELRLRKTAEFMKEHNDRCRQNDTGDSERPGFVGELPFDFFATTLTLSPLKDADVLNDIAAQLAEQYGTPALCTDFKKKNGYKRSIELSHEYGLYRQDYCGCRYSKAAREAQKSNL